MKVVLVAIPGKLTDKSYTISKKQVFDIADKGHSIIIDNELYSLFKDGVRTQLEKLLQVLFNKGNDTEKKSSKKSSLSENEKISIVKLEEISLFRNALIHNGGKISIEIDKRVRYFKQALGKQEITFDYNLVNLFMKEYKDFFKYLNTKIKGTYNSYSDLSIIEKTEILWQECFPSPMLQFREYWDFDNEHDLITGIKYPEIENNLSSSEKVLLSIWRHQFDDTIKTEEFSICSVNYHLIYKLYKGLDDLKFCHMKQKSDQNK